LSLRDNNESGYDESTYFHLKFKFEILKKLCLNAYLIYSLSFTQIIIAIKVNVFIVIVINVLMCNENVSHLDIAFAHLIMQLTLI
jgi:hypothetical protein